MQPISETNRQETVGTAPPVPRLLGGRYRLEERLGEGGLGVVWRARHLGLQRDVALKLLRAAPYDSQALARFQREAEALGRLRHPHVVEVTDFGVDDESGTPYLAMELLPPRTLADLLREAGALPATRALPLLEALAAAVDAAHAQGILHRDLKPCNIALLGDLLKVLDFGLAEIAAPSQEAPPGTPQGEQMAGKERLTSTGALLGTPLYAAPEVIRDGTACRASDIYSLGVIAYEMLTGRPPFTGSTAEVLAGHLQRKPPEPELAAPVWEALRQALRKDPDDRPATATGFVRRLRRAVEQCEEACRRRAELPRRLLLAAAVAAGSLAVGLLLPPAGVPPIERRLDDLRIEMAPPRPPDPRILLVTLDESSLRNGAAPLAGRAEEVGNSLAAIFAAGARGVAVDLLLPAQWRQSPAFVDVVLRHPEALTLAAFSGPDGEVGGIECVSGLIATALGPRRTTGLFAFVNLDEDPDGATRTGRLSFRDEAEGERPSWAARAAARLGAAPRLPAGAAFRIDHRIDSDHYPRLLWRDLPTALVQRPQIFRDRLVLVGSDSPDAGDDYHEIPVRLGEIGAISGLALQALQIDTITAGLPVRAAPRLPILLLAALLAGAAALIVLQRNHAGRAALGLAACAALYTAASLPFFESTGLVLPVTAPCLVAALGLAAGLTLRRFLPTPGSSPR
jgi:CHASE2 domain-containing sensor protein